MNLLTIFQNHGRYVKVSSNKGGEHHGPCPKCGGTDRFVIWPERNGFWCRQCSWNGDDIEALRHLESLSCKEAFDRVGRQCGKEDCPSWAKCSGTTTPRRPAQQTGTASVPARRVEQSRPVSATEPVDIWREKAEKLIDYAHQQLLACPDKLTWLAGRGLDLSAVQRYGLGWLPEDMYRDRAAWGLPVEMKDNGKPKKLWLPKGVTIPYRLAGQLHRIRIRRDEVTGDNPRYYWLPGSGNDVVVLSPGRRAAVVVESDLDGLLADYLAGDLVSTIPMGSSSAKPKAAAAKQLDESAVILVALDFDTAGTKAWAWWRDTYPGKASRWPVPVGKDPGEAYQQGVDIRSWLVAGLPVSLQPPAPAPQPVPEVTLPVAAAVEPAQLVHTITARDGRTIHITDHPGEYARLVAEGKIVFDSREIALVKASATTPEQAASYLNIKQTWPGSRIDSLTPLDPAPAESTVVREAGTCYWSKKED